MNLYIVIFVLLTILPTVACPQKAQAAAPSLFISEKNLQSFKSRAAAGDEPFSSIVTTLNSLANGYLTATPNPFIMADVTEADFGWCDSVDSTDDTLLELVTKLRLDSDKARNLALNYLLTGNESYAQKAGEFLTAWAENSTLINFYDFNIDFINSTFDGIESEEYCDRSWHMALDSIFQVYGLINFSDTYIILTRNNYSASEEEKVLWGNWLRNELMPAVNAGFHAWTRWADAHPSSSAYIRYRSDNHLSWGLAGLAAAAAALNDSALWSYVLEGGGLDDGHSGLYQNPSYFKAQVGMAINDSGRIYDQDERAPQHKGFHYANFSLWALSITAMIAETQFGQSALWTYEGASGGSLAKAYDYYSPYVAGTVALEDAEETISPEFYRFLYEPIIGKSWAGGSRKAAYMAARDSGSRDQFIQQAVGPYALVTAGYSQPSFLLMILPLIIDREN